MHCHTWYPYLAGCLIKQFLEIPMVITVHSLEPKRPWKREQIGTGYNQQLAEENRHGECRRDHPVSQGVKYDILYCYQPDSEKIRVIYNGFDTLQYQTRYSGNFHDQGLIRPVNANDSLPSFRA